jgi:peptidoglycan/xylan/chitin deacetylase (PgdA/CDA1 family)
MPPLKNLAKRAVLTLADTRVGRGFLLRNAAGFVPVFMLHRFTTADGLVSGHDPLLVRAALDYLHGHDFRVLTIDQIVEGLIEGTLPDRAVAFTIDDGYQDQGQVGAELFIASGFPCTLYLVTELVEGRYWPMEAKVRYLFSQASTEFRVQVLGRQIPVSSQDAARKDEVRRRLVYELKTLPLAGALERVDQLSDQLGLALPEIAPAAYRPFSWDDVRELERRGISFGAHTTRHVTLSAESDEVAWRELKCSTEALKANVRQPSNVFCYPTGRFQDYGPREIGFLEKLGYRAAISSEPGYCMLGDKPADRFNLLRFSFPDTLEEFKDIVLQLPRLREKFRVRK